MYVLYHYILKEQSVYVNKESNHLIRLPHCTIRIFKITGETCSKISAKEGHT